MSTFAQPDIDRILENYNVSFEYTGNEQKLKKRKIFIDDLIEKFVPTKGDER